MKNKPLARIEDYTKGILAGAKMIQEMDPGIGIRRMKANAEAVIRECKILEAQEFLKQQELVGALNICGEVLKESPKNDECLVIVQNCLEINPNLKHHLGMFGIRYMMN